MALTRSDATAYLAGTLAELLAESGVGTTDVTGALKEPIDAALRAVGVSQTDLPTATVADASAAGFLAALDYHGLLRIQRALARRVDLNLDGPSMSKRYSQAVEAVKGMVADAKAEMIAHGVGVGGSWTVGTVTLGIYETDETLTA